MDAPSRGVRRRPGRTARGPLVRPAALGIHDTVLLDRAYTDASYAVRRADAFVVAVTCSDPGGTCFCVSMGTGPRPKPGAARRTTSRMTEILDATATASWSRPAVRAGRRCWRAGRDRMPTTATVADATSVARAAADRMGRDDGHGRPQGSAVRQRRQPDVGRGRLPVPVLLATARWSAPRASAPTSRTSPTSPATTVQRSGSGTPASTSTTPTCTAARSAVGHRALPAVDDPQARLLDRPVRHLGLRRLRALHHVVPGRHRHHRAGRGAARGGTDHAASPRRLRRAPVLRRARARTRRR